MIIKVPEFASSEKINRYTKSIKRKHVFRYPCIPAALMHELPQQITYPHQTISWEWTPNYHSLCWGFVSVCLVILSYRKTDHIFFLQNCKYVWCQFVLPSYSVSDESRYLQTSFTDLNRHVKAQVFSHWLLTTETWIQSWDSPYGIFGRQNRNGASSSLPVTITPLLHTHHQWLVQ
jgi:hypothetical protein